MFIVVNRPRVSSLTISSGVIAIKAIKRKLRKMQIGKSRIVSNKKPMFLIYSKNETYETLHLKQRGLSEQTCPFISNIK